MKWIASESTRAVLLVGTYELLRFARVSGRLGRRVTHIAYRPYDWARDKHRREFKKALTFFLKQLPVRSAASAVTDEDLRLFFARLARLDRPAEGVARRSEPQQRARQ